MAYAKGVARRDEDMADHIAMSAWGMQGRGTANKMWGGMRVLTWQVKGIKCCAKSNGGVH